MVSHADSSPPLPPTWAISVWTMAPAPAAWVTWTLGDWRMGSPSPRLPRGLTDELPFSSANSSPSQPGLLGWGPPVLQNLSQPPPSLRILARGGGVLSETCPGVVPGPEQLLAGRCGQVTTWGLGSSVPSCLYST